MFAPTQPTPTHDTPILVIDDDSSICKMLVEVLTMEGYIAGAALIPYDQPAEAVATAATLHALQHAAEPTIILAGPMTFFTPSTATLTAYLQDKARRQPHLLYLMTALRGENAARAMAQFHADGRISMPIEIEHLLALIASAERILRDRTANPPDPFTIDTRLG